MDFDLSYFFSLSLRVSLPHLHLLNSQGKPDSHFHRFLWSFSSTFTVLRPIRFFFLHFLQINSCNRAFLSFLFHLFSFGSFHFVLLFHVCFACIRKERKDHNTKLMTLETGILINSLSSQKQESDATSGGKLKNSNMEIEVQNYDLFFLFLALSLRYHGTCFETIFLSKGSNYKTPLMPFLSLPRFLTREENGCYLISPPPFLLLLFLLTSPSSDILKFLPFLLLFLPQLPLFLLHLLHCWFRRKGKD